MNRNFIKKYSPLSNKQVLSENRAFAQKMFYRMGKQENVRKQTFSKMVYVEGETNQNSLPQELDPIALSSLIYSYLKTLEQKYEEDLNPSKELLLLKDELKLVTFSILRVYQTLANTNSVPKQENFERLEIEDLFFQILYNLRSLQRQIDIADITRELMLDNQTILAHQIFVDEI